MRKSKTTSDYTPYPVALQGVLAIQELFCLEPERVLDPSAGSGVFGQAFRTVWPNATTTAVEPKRSESWYLSRNYDNHAIGTFEGIYGPGDGSLPSPNFDLVMTNPPFHLWRDFIAQALRLVRPGGYVVYLGLTSWNGRGEAGYDFFEETPPVAEMLIPGAVSFRIKGADMRDYCFWVFQRSRGERPLPCWVAFNLPRLPSPFRRWNLGTKPGRTDGPEFQENSPQHLLSALRERCLPRRIFVPPGEYSR